MPRRFLTLLLFAPAALAGIWPEQWDTHFRKTAKPIVVTDKALWNELGLEEAEEATYENFRATAYRLRDSTSALAAQQWLGEGRLIGNYLLNVTGYQPTQREWDLLQIQIPRLDQKALPQLPTYLPPEGLITGSKRFVIGPVGLAKFENRISPSLAGFSIEAEVQLARYKTPAGDLDLALISYPAPQMAKEKSVKFGEIPGAAVKRTGPIVAVVLKAPNADEAEKVLAKINYQAVVTWNERIATRKTDMNIGELILGAFRLIGALILFSLFAGLSFAGLKLALRKLRGETEEDQGMTSLRL